MRKEIYIQNGYDTIKRYYITECGLSVETCYKGYFSNRREQRPITKEEIIALIRAEQGALGQEIMLLEKKIQEIEKSC